MKNVTLQFPKAGESKLYGYAGKMIDYTVDAQLLDEETWALFVNQFRIKSDRDDNGWRGEFWGKMMRGGALTYRATKNEKLYSVLAKTALDLISTQQENGRITTYGEGKEFCGWDLWASKYVMLGLLYFLEICKSKTLARKITVALKKHANAIMKRIGPKRTQTDILDTSGVFGAMNSCSILEAYVKLYAVTGEKKYLDYATYIVNSGLCKGFDLVKQCQTKTLYPYQFAQTKAYEMTSCFEGLLEYYKITQNPDHLLAVENFAELVVESDYTLIGCSGCTHELFDNSSLKQTEPASEEVMQETCVTVTFMKFCTKLLSVTGKAKYATYIEKSGLNALYGAVNNENQTMWRTIGRVWYEKDKLFVHEPFPFDSYSPLYQDVRGYRIGGFQPLQGDRSYGCCACIGSAGTAIMGLYAVMKGEDGVYVNFYNDCRFKTNDYGEKISVDVYANPYQYKGAKVNVKGGGQTFTVALRVPEWAEDFTAYVNGEKVVGETENGYLKINRAWYTDKIILRFKAPVKARVLNGKIAFTAGPITLARDCRLDDISAPVQTTARNGKNVRAKRVENKAFASNVAYELSTKDGKITLCDYAQAGKNLDDERRTITVWQDRK